MRKVIILILFIIFSMTAWSQHMSQYSQYMFNGAIINPAYAGSQDALSVSLLHRNQWLDIKGAPTSSSISIHSPLKNKNINLGFNITSNHYGVSVENLINGAFAYKLKFRASTLSIGLQAGLNSSTHNWLDINTTSGTDVVFDGLTEKNISPTAGFGLYYKAKQYYLGLSVPSLIKIGSLADTYNPLFINGGYLYEISNDFKLKPSFLFKLISNSPMALDFNLNAYYKTVGLGLSYRNKDAIVFLFHAEINQQLSVGYSYDYAISELSLYNKGTHEIMLKYNFVYKLKAMSSRYF